MGQSKSPPPVMSRSTTSLDAMCDIAELKLSNLQLGPAFPSHRQCCRSGSVDESWCGFVPCQTEDSDTDGSNSSCAMGSLKPQSPDGLEGDLSTQLPAKVESSTNSLFSGVTVVTDTKHHDTSVSVSVTCQGSINGKKWSFQLHDVTGGIDDEELADVVQSVRSAIGTTLNVADSTQQQQQQQQQASPTMNCPRRFKLVDINDDTALSVVSRDSGLPHDLEHIQLSSSYQSSSTGKHSIPGQYVLLQAMSDDPASRLEECPAQTPVAKPLTPNVNEDIEAPSPPQAEQPSSTGKTNNSYVCSRCRRPRAKKPRTDRKVRSQKCAAGTRGKEALTLTSVDQDAVEDYFLYLFCNVSDQEDYDVKSLTFSEYMLDGDSGSRDEAKHHDDNARRRRRKRHQRAPYREQAKSHSRPEENEPEIVEQS